MGQKLESTSEKFERENVRYVESERGGMERVVTRSLTQQSINRSQANDSRNALRAGSFIPRMVRKFNDLPLDEKVLPNLGTQTEEERWAEHKRNLRNKCPRPGPRTERTHC